MLTVLADGIHPYLIQGCFHSSASYLFNMYVNESNFTKRYPFSVQTILHIAAVSCSPNAYRSVGVKMGLGLMGKLGHAWVGTWMVHGWCIAWWRWCGDGVWRGGKNAYVYTISILYRLLYHIDHLFFIIFALIQQVALILIKQVCKMSVFCQYIICFQYGSIYPQEFDSNP